MKRIIKYTYVNYRIDDLREEAKKLRAERFELTMRLRGLNKRIKELAKDENA